MRDLTAVILPDIHDLIQSGSPEQLREAVGAFHPADVADLLLNLEDSDALTLFLALDAPQRAETFEHLEEEQQELLLERLNPNVMASVVDAMSSDDRADLFKRLPEKLRDVLLPLLAQAERNDVRRLIEFREGTAGSIMSTEYTSVRPEMTVAKALEHLRRDAPQRETIYIIYVTDEERRLLGVVSLQQLILANPAKKVSEMMRRDVIALPVGADREEVARTVAKYDFLALPIVDAEGRLVGIVTHDDVIDVMEAEHSEDVQLSAAIGPTEIPYSRASTWLLFRKRVGWLLILAVADFLSGSVIAYFEDALTAVVALAFFIPVLIDSGGNTGAQSSTLVIRALGTGDLTVKDWLRVVGRELWVGLFLGLALGGVLFARGFFWRGGTDVALVVGLTMIVLVLWANLVGAILPMILQRLKLDPAVVSAPFITTLVDSTGLFIYFTIATWILGLGDGPPAEAAAP